MEFTSFDEMTQEMRRRATDLRHASRNAVREATDILHAESKRLMDIGIYSIPEDRTGWSFKKTGRGTGDEAFALRKSGKRRTTSKGRKKWTRTGNLRRSETSGMVSDEEGYVLNDAGYAIQRHDLGLPAGHPEAVQGSRRQSRRIAPWRKRAITRTEAARRQVFRNAFFDVLSR